jgi:hypothetical protein
MEATGAGAAGAAVLCWPHAAAPISAHGKSKAAIKYRCLPKIAICFALII